MTTHRPERVAELIQELLARLIREKVRDPRVGFATVTDVRVTPDLKRARVFVSRLGTPEERATAVAALNRASSFLRGAVARETRLKYVPLLSFSEDTALETGLRVEHLLEKIHEERGETSPEGDDDGPEDERE